MKILIVHGRYLFARKILSDRKIFVWIVTLWCVAIVTIFHAQAWWNDIKKIASDFFVITGCKWKNGAYNFKKANIYLSWRNMHLIFVNWIALCKSKIIFLEFFCAEKSIWFNILSSICTKFFIFNAWLVLWMRYVNRITHDISENQNTFIGNLN